EISQAVAPISSRKVVVRNLPRRTRPASSLTRCLSASIIPAPFQIRLLISGSFDGHDETNGRAVNRPRPGGALKPRAYQRQIGCAGDQQRHWQRDVHLLGISHGRDQSSLLGANIRRFYPGRPGLSFLPDSPLVKDSRTPAKRPETGHFRPSPARDRGVKWPKRNPSPFGTLIGL